MVAGSGRVSPRHRHQRRCGNALLGALALVSASCQTFARPGGPRPDDPISLTVSRNNYEPGAVVSLALTNRTERTYGYNPCTRVIEGLASGGTWVAVSEPNRLCTMELRLLEPRTERVSQTELPSPLGEGTYRMVIALSLQGEGQEPAAPASVSAITNIFSVSEP